MNLEAVNQGWVVHPYQPAVVVRNTLATIVQIIIEIVRDLFCFDDEQCLSYVEVISYLDGFNQSQNSTHIVRADNYTLETLRERNWTAFNKNDLEHSTAYKVLGELITNNNRLYVPNGKRFLSIPVFIHDGHWTSVHVDLQNHRLYYLDSLGETRAYYNRINYHALIQRYLTGLKECLEFLCPGQTFTIERGAHSPSVIEKAQQFDGFNCGVFMVHYASIAAELAQRRFELDFRENYANIWSRRAHMVQVLA